VWIDTADAFAFAIFFLSFLFVSLLCFFVVFLLSYIFLVV